MKSNIAIVFLNVNWSTIVILMLKLLVSNSRELLLVFSLFKNLKRCFFF